MSYSNLDAIFVGNNNVSNSKCLKIVPFNVQSKTINDKSIISFLQEGSMKFFGKNPIYQEKIDNGFFVVKCITEKWEEFGSGLSKKIAKRNAAKKVLLSIVKDNQFNEFGIPGNSKLQAETFISNMVSDFDDEKSENWISRCNELRQKKKLPCIIFNFDENKDSNCKFFYCTASLNNFIGKGTGRCKKTAQNNACYDLYNNLENEAKLSSQEKYTKKLNQPNYELINLNYSNMMSIPDFYNFLKKIMNNGLNFNFNGSMEILTKIIKMPNLIVKKIFDVKSENPIHYYFVDIRTSNGQIQCFLEIKSMFKSKLINIWGGQGLTKSDAADDAAWQALQHLYVFGNVEKFMINDCVIANK